MAKQTNPRKITTSGGMNVVSIPDDFLKECGLKKGDRVVLFEAENGFDVSKVEFKRVHDE